MRPNPEGDDMVADQHRFTDFGNAELELRIAGDLERIADVAQEHLGDRFHTLVLGGGYGRSEGGGRQRSDAWEPYNDYDLFVIVDGVPAWRRSSLRSEIAALGRSLEEELNLEVELSAIRAEDLSTLPFTMMWCELLGGHHVVRGTHDALRAAPEMAPDQLPLFEGVHYLSNRAALILWGLVEDLGADRTWKFIHKAWLAIGAAALIGDGRFRIGYDLRLQEIEDKLPEGFDGIPMILERYREAAHARKRPTPAPAAGIVEERRQEVTQALLVCWRWLEKRRIGREFPGFEDYASAPHLFSEPWPDRPMNVVRQLRLLGSAGLQPAGVTTEHPRSRPIRAIPALLEQRRLSPAVARLVGGGSNWTAAARRCIELWKRC
jgi:hypothetical protein